MIVKMVEYESKKQRIAMHLWREELGNSFSGDQVRQVGTEICAAPILKV